MSRAESEGALARAARRDPLAIYVRNSIAIGTVKVGGGLTRTRRLTWKEAAATAWLARRALAEAQARDEGGERGDA